MIDNKGISLTSPLEAESSLFLLLNMFLVYFLFYFYVFEREEIIPLSNTSKFFLTAMLFCEFSFSIPSYLSFWYCSEFVCPPWYLHAGFQYL